MQKMIINDQNQEQKTKQINVVVEKTIGRKSSRQNTTVLFCSKKHLDAYEYHMHPGY